MSQTEAEKLTSGAWDALFEEEFKKARPLIDQALQLAPDDIRVHEVDEQWYQRNDDVEFEEGLAGCINAVERMIALNPDDDEETFYLTDSYDNGLYSKYASLLFHRAEINKSVIDMKAMFKAFEKSSSLRGETFWLAYTREACLSQLLRVIDHTDIESEFGDIVELKLKYLDALIAVDIRHPGEARGEKGELLQKHGRYAEAIEQYEKIYELKPEYYIAMLATAECQLELKQYDRALENCIQVPPDYEYGYKKLYLEAQALARLGRNDEALQKIKEYVGDGKGIELTEEILTNPHLVSLWDNVEFNRAVTHKSVDKEWVDSERQRML